MFPGGMASNGVSRGGGGKSLAISPSRSLCIFIKTRGKRTQGTRSVVKDESLCPKALNEFVSNFMMGFIVLCEDINCPALA